MPETHKENISVGTRNQVLKGKLINQGPRKALCDSNINQNSQHTIPKNVLKEKSSFIQPCNTLASKLKKGAAPKPTKKSVIKVQSHTTIATKSKPIEEKKKITADNANIIVNLTNLQVTSPIKETLPKEEIITDNNILAVNLKNIPLQVTSSIIETVPEEEINDDDFDNTIFLGNYVQDIYNYLFRLEKTNCVCPHYLKNNPKVNGNMRALLIDWLVEVHQEFKLEHETLYLTVGILDRFLQSSTIASKKNLQMIGVVCMWIASKYEEVFFLSVRHLVEITDYTVSIDELKCTEGVILKQIGFNLGIPLQSHFLRRFSKLAKVNERQHNLAKYLMELTLIDHKWSHVPPSAVAAGSLYLSLLIHSNFQEDFWTNKLSLNSRYTAEDLKPVIASLARLLITSQKSNFKAVTMKYRSRKHLKIVQSLPLESPDLIKLAAL